MIVNERLKQISFDQTIIGKIIKMEKINEVWVY
jgi:hypothetical protein